MMRLERKMVLLLFLSLIPAFALTTGLANGGFAWRQEKNEAFKVGEYLKFDVVWEFIPVGTGTLEIPRITEIDGRKAYHIVSRANSSAFFDTFYKVRDLNQSWMDVESLCSLKNEKKEIEGGFRSHETVFIDQKRNEFMVAESSKSGAIPVWAHDVLSSLYYLRTKKLVVGESHTFDSYQGGLAWPLVVDVLRTEEIDTILGRVKCWVVEPKVRPGANIFKAKGTLMVWLTADDKKLPVLLRSRISVGRVEARLSEMKLE